MAAPHPPEPALAETQASSPGVGPSLIDRASGSPGPWTFAMWPALSGDWASRLLVGSVVGLTCVAVLFVFDTAVATGAGDPASEAAGYLTFVLGVIVAALLGGVWAGVIATMIAAAAELTLFNGASGSAGIGTAAGTLRLALFLVDGTIVSVLSHALLGARVRGELGRHELTRLYEAEQVARKAAEGAELLRRQLHEDEQRARAQAEASRVTMAFLANASRLLAESSDQEATIQQLADLVVPTLADWCAVDIVEPDGTIRALAVSHADPSKVGLLREYRERFPPGQRHGSATAIATGAPVLFPVLDDAMIDAASPSPEVADYAKRLQIRSYIAVPLRTVDGVIGAMAFASATPGRYGPDDVALVEDLAHRAGDAIRHARLYRDARQFVATVDATLDAVFMFEPHDLRFTYVNQGAVNQVGWTREELLGMRAIDIKPSFDEPRYRELIAPLIDGSKASLTFSTGHLHRDGSQVPVEAFLQAVHLPGGAIRVIIMARDIRRQIEVEASLYRLARAERARAAELSAVIHGMGEGVLVCDATGAVILSNPAAATILGVSIERYDDLLALVEESAPGLPVLGSASGPLEVRVGRTDRWIDLSTYPVSLDPTELADDGETTIIVLRDVTAARQARAAREAFIGVLSHELRTPITTIYGTAKLMHKITDPDRTRAMLEDVEAEADRLHRLVEDLLILSRAETGIQIEGEPVLLQHVIRSVIAGESPRWPGTTFMALVPPGLPPVSGDRTYLEQIVRNLAANAAKYGPPTSTVEVKAEIRDGEIAVLVLDEGPGFAVEEAGSLFDLFYRSPSTAKKASGAGIGLYVARALVEAMGGRIWARPRPGGGAEFGFTVPILEGDGEASPEDPGDDGAAAVEPRHLSRLHALDESGVAIP